MSRASFQCLAEEESRSPGDDARSRSTSIRKETPEAMASSGSPPFSSFRLMRPNRISSPGVTRWDSRIRSPLTIVPLREPRSSR